MAACTSENKRKGKQKTKGGSDESPLLANGAH